MDEVYIFGIVNKDKRNNIVRDITETSWKITLEKELPMSSDILMIRFAAPRHQYIELKDKYDWLVYFAIEGCPKLI